MRSIASCFGWLALAALVAVAGCAPTVFGDRSVSGERPKALMGGDARYDFQRSLKFNAISKGEMITLTVTTPGGEQCVVDFKLAEMVKSYPLIPFMPHDKELRYQGQWPDNLSSDCQKVAEAPGGTPATLRVFEPDGGQRHATVCTNDTTGLCTDNINIVFKMES